MPTGHRNIPQKPMRKWCKRCEEFKDNPKNRKNPRYCEDCLRMIFLKGLRKRKENERKL